MTLYATTAIPSLDFTSAIHTLQRISGPVISLSHIGWNEKDHLCVAILKTETPEVLNHLSESLKRFDVELSKASFLSTAIRNANQIAQVVEFEDIREDNLNEL